MTWTKGLKLQWNNTTWDLGANLIELFSSECTHSFCKLDCFSIIHYFSIALKRSSLLKAVNNFALKSFKGLSPGWKKLNTPARQGLSRDAGGNVIKPFFRLLLTVPQNKLTCLSQKSFTRQVYYFWSHSRGRNNFKIPYLGRLWPNPKIL